MCTHMLFSSNTTSQICQPKFCYYEKCALLTLFIIQLFYANPSFWKYFTSEQITQAECRSTGNVIVVIFKHFFKDDPLGPVFSWPLCYLYSLPWR